MTFDKIYQYNFPTIIRFGAGSSKELGDYLNKYNLSKPLIVTDANVAQLDFFKALIADLKKKNIGTEVFSDIHKNPVKSDVYKGTDIFDNTKRDSIVGIGGGAALDVARAIVLRVNHREDLFKYDDLIGGDVYVTNDVPHLLPFPPAARGVKSVEAPSSLMMKRIRRKYYFLPNYWQGLSLLIHS
jgi:alcohol dehydrogenase class IV